MCEALLRRIVPYFKENSFLRGVKYARGSSSLLAPCKTIGIRAYCPIRRLLAGYFTDYRTSTGYWRRTTSSGSLNRYFLHSLCLCKQSSCFSTQRKTLGHLLREFCCISGGRINCVYPKPSRHNVKQENPLYLLLSKFVLLQKRLFII